MVTNDGIPVTSQTDYLMAEIRILTQERSRLREQLEEAKRFLQRRLKEKDDEIAKLRGELVKRTLDRDAMALDRDQAALATQAADDRLLQGRA